MASPQDIYYGESLPLSGTDALEVGSPEEADILLIRNGKEVARS
jgi:hypothetical protein